MPFLTVNRWNRKPTLHGWSGTAATGGSDVNKIIAARSRLVFDLNYLLLENLHRHKAPESISDPWLKYVQGVPMGHPGDRLYGTDLQFIWPETLLLALRGKVMCR